VDLAAAQGHERTIGSQARDEEFFLEEQFLGEVVIEAEEEFILEQDFALPFLDIDGQGTLEVWAPSSYWSGPLHPSFPYTRR
jgi:hypothetical protein